MGSKRTEIDGDWPDDWPELATTTANELRETVGTVTDTLLGDTYFNEEVATSFDKDLVIIVNAVTAEKAKRLTRQIKALRYEQQCMLEELHRRADYIEDLQYELAAVKTLTEKQIGDALTARLLEERRAEDAE